MQPVLQNLDLRLNELLKYDGLRKGVCEFGAVLDVDEKNSVGFVSGSSGRELVDSVFHVIYHPSMESFVSSFKKEASRKICGKTFYFYETTWGRFNDGTDEMKIQNMTSPTHFRGLNVLFVASFHNNDATMSQFHMITFLCQCFVRSLTVLLPYYSTGTMERVDIGADGIVPTANTLAMLFNGLPSVGFPIRVMTYDLHTLQNRFYFSGHALSSLHTAIPLIIKVIRDSESAGGDNVIRAVVFPDEGSHKRFGILFQKAGIKMIICSKVRNGDEKKVTLSSSGEDLRGDDHVMLIDDQTKSGGTLIECAGALKEHGFEKFSAFVTHAVCTDEFWSKFVSKNKIIKIDARGERSSPYGSSEDDVLIPISIFKKFYCTDSYPVSDVFDEFKTGKELRWKKTVSGVVTQYMVDSVDGGRREESVKDILHILPLAEQVLEDL